MSMCLNASNASDLVRRPPVSSQGPLPWPVRRRHISSRAGRQNAAGRELAAGEVYLVVSNLVVQNRDKHTHKLLIQKALQNTNQKRKVRCRSVIIRSGG